MTLLWCGLAVQALAQNPPSTSTSAIPGSAPAAARQEEERLKLEQDKLVVAREKLEMDQAKVARDIWKDWAAIAQSILTAISIAIAGAWVFVRFVWAQERYPNVEFTADINLVGVHGDWIIAELIAYIENKGKVQHKMTKFKFWLDALLDQDPIEVDQRWGGQVNFPRAIAEGSFLPDGFGPFFVDPGTKAKYSWVARVPFQARFLLLHCRFEYSGRGPTKHTAERSIRVPDNLEGSLATSVNEQNAISPPAGRPPAEKPKA